MSQNPVIKHYKKQLIYRQYDSTSPPVNPPKEFSDNDIYQFMENERLKNDAKNKAINYANETNKTRNQKRKNKNCRGQFRHEGLELIKLGTKPSSKEPPVKPTNLSRNKDDQSVPTNPQKKSEDFPQNNDKLIFPSSIYGHPLPQMVPERRNSKEILLKTVEESPPRPPSPPYREPPLAKPPNPKILNPPPPYPTFHRINSYPPNIPEAACHFADSSVPPPSYYSHQYSRGVPRRRGRPPLHQSPARHSEYPLDGIYTSQAQIKSPIFPYPPFIAHQQYQQNERKRGIDSIALAKNEIKQFIESKKNKMDNIIDLTVDNKQINQEKCEDFKCSCGKPYEKTKASRKSLGDDVDAQLFRGKVYKGIIVLEQCIDHEKTRSTMDEAEKREKDKEKTRIKSPAVPPPITKVNSPPQLFLIKDLLAKGQKFPSSPITNRSKDVNINPENTPKAVITKYAENDVFHTYRKNETVIVSTKNRNPEPNTFKKLNPPLNNSFPKYRSDSVEIDTMSVCSSGSESIQSPTLKPQLNVPQGKLFYVKNNNSFIRYFVDTQKKLFIDNLIADSNSIDDVNSEVIVVPEGTAFNCKESLAVEEYVNEMILVEKIIPRDFFLFYKFVTGYQICKNNLPVSFLTFLNIFNTNGLKELLDKYVKSMK